MIRLLALTVLFFTLRGQTAPAAHSRAPVDLEARAALEILRRRLRAAQVQIRMLNAELSKAGSVNGSRRSECPKYPDAPRPQSRPQQ